MYCCIFFYFKNTNKITVEQIYAWLKIKQECRHDSKNA